MKECLLNNSGKEVNNDQYSVCEELLPILKHVGDSIHCGY